ncbi:MAG: FecR domain-containing protein [Mediterranea sp.]|jgi:ferric-dicitrate binding protein FerR (iron transport regulator)|nr:FecR domain-containing protein [Mediterranea sp.]
MNHHRHLPDAPLLKLMAYYKQQESAPSPQELEEGWRHVRKRVERRERRKLYVAATATVAAAATLAGLAWFALPTDTPLPLDKQQASMQWKADMDTLSDIRVVVAPGQSIRVDSGATVSYSSTGNIAVNRQVVDQTKTSTRRQPTATSTEAGEYNQIIVPRGKTSTLLLADGTSMHINAGTRVAYPRTFGTDKRKIHVDGEVYLDIAHREHQPFVVQTAKFDIEVLGTAFNVDAYSDNSQATVVLLRGQVKILDSNRQEALMKPNELLAVNEGQIAEKKEVNAEEYIAWTRSLIFLHGEPLEEVCRKLYRYYGVPVETDASCAHIPIHGKLDISIPLKEILRRISVATSLNVQERGDTIRLQR